MLDLIAAVQAELSGPRATTYAPMTDAAAATALMNSGQIYQDVPISSVAGYCELNQWNGAGPYIMEQLQVLANAPGSAQVIAAKALRMFSGATQCSVFALSDPNTAAGLKGMLAALVAANMAAANQANILALGIPTITAQIVTAARILNGIAYAPWSWTSSAPVANAQNANATVTITVKNTTTGETQTTLAIGSDLTKAIVNKQAALLIANLVSRDAAIAALEA